jgi:glycosyltransferase involved in cell wall biosynthesis
MVNALVPRKVGRMSPKISVIMATYNHAPYVDQAIRSVVDQSFSDFELLIVDDGSQDETASVVAGFADRRIRFIARAENRGSAASRNELIRLSRGQYIAVQNSDDYWPLDKLAYQFEFLENNPDFAAIFGRASFVDQNGVLVPNPSSVFDQDNRSPALWLRRFFDGSNCLCHPTVMLRRSCQIDLGEYDRRYRQLTDMDMWVRLSKKYRLFVSDRSLTFFRVHDGSISNPTTDARTRFYNDQYLIAGSLFDGMSRDMLVEGFHDLLMLKDPPSEAHCDIEKALVYFRVNSSFRFLYKVLGLKRLHDLLASPIHRQILVADYGIDDLAFQRLSTETDTFRQAVEAHGAVEQRADRDARIPVLEQSVLELEARVGTLGRVVADRDTQIAEILASTSWRVTKPLRFAGRLLRSSRYRHDDPSRS